MTPFGRMGVVNKPRVPSGMIAYIGGSDTLPPPLTR